MHGERRARLASKRLALPHDFYDSVKGLRERASMSTRQHQATLKQLNVGMFIPGAESVDQNHFVSTTHKSRAKISKLSPQWRLIRKLRSGIAERL
jgi:hypothetical protein